MSWKDKFQGFHKNQRKTYFRLFGVLCKVSNEIHGFYAPVDSLQDFQIPLDTLLKSWSY